MAVYVCGKCNFMFERIQSLEDCPDCGRPCVRVATPDEEAIYLKDRENIRLETLELNDIEES